MLASCRLTTPVCDLFLSILSDLVLAYQLTAHAYVGDSLRFRRGGASNDGLSDDELGTGPSGDNFGESLEEQRHSRLVLWGLFLWNIGSLIRALQGVVNTPKALHHKLFGWRVETGHVVSRILALFADELSTMRITSCLLLTLTICDMLLFPGDSLMHPSWVSSACKLMSHASSSSSAPPPPPPNTYPAPPDVTR